MIARIANQILHCCPSSLSSSIPASTAFRSTAYLSSKYWNPVCHGITVVKSPLIWRLRDDGASLVPWASLSFPFAHFTCILSFDFLMTQATPVRMYNYLENLGGNDRRTKDALRTPRRNDFVFPWDLGSQQIGNDFCMNRHLYGYIRQQFSLNGTSPHVQFGFYFLDWKLASESLIRKDVSNGAGSKYRKGVIPFKLTFSTKLISSPWL